MKIVIVSDTHGSRKNIENVCECNPDADMLIHLGDVEDDADYIEAIFECPTHIVGGNNDFFSRLPREEEFELEGHHIFNPGSLTYPRQQGRQATYMVMKLEKGKQPEVELKTV